MKKEKFSQVIILGSGPAGYSAAIYCARAMLNPLLITGQTPGGQLANVKDIENYPGYQKPISGPFLMNEMAIQAELYGTKIVYDHIISADLSKKPFSLYGENGMVYSCNALIIATGAKAKWLGLKSEDALMGRGVSACATCDGFFYKGKKVAVVGGGNVAVEEALYLSHLAEQVTLIHRRDELRAERILQDRLKKQKNIQILWNHTVEEILGKKDKISLMEVVHALKLKNTTTQEISNLLVDGVFIAIGHSPASDIFSENLRRNEMGYILTKANSTKTNIEGVFAAGDVTNTLFRQAVVAAGQGCTAALETEHFLLMNDFLKS